MEIRFNAFTWEYPLRESHAVGAAEAKLQQDYLEAERNGW